MRLSPTSGRNCKVTGCIVDNPGKVKNMAETQKKVPVHRTDGENKAF